MVRRANHHQFEAKTERVKLLEVRESATRSALLRTGEVDVLPAPPRRYVYPRFSPDGTRLALQIDEADGANVFIYDIARLRLQQLTFDGGTVPLWTPDGTQVTFLSGDALWNIASDFSGTPERLSGASEEFGIAGPYSWSPDGTTRRCELLTVSPIAAKTAIWLEQRT